MQNKNVAFYGSLRKGEYNAKRLGITDDMFIDTNIPISGWSLYSLGSYPGAVNDNSNNELVVDIISVPEHLFEVIDRMEVGAGYKAIIVNVNDKDCIIYDYKGSVDTNDIVKSGDWSKYLKERRKNEENSINVQAG